MRTYLNEKCDREIVWIFEKNGNEGKFFFQENIEYEFGYSRLCTMELTENARNTFHVLRKLCPSKLIHSYSIFQGNGTCLMKTIKFYRI